MKLPRVALSASVLLCLLSASLLACSGDDDDDTFGLDAGIVDATTADSSDGSATDAADANAVDSASLTCVGGGGMCALSAQSCATTGGSLVGTPIADNGCQSAGFGASSVCCSTLCGASPGNVCMFGALGMGPPYCQNGKFVCPNGTIVDAGGADAATADSGTDAALDAANDAG